MEDDYPYQKIVLNNKNEEITITMLRQIHETKNKERKIWLIKDDQMRKSILKGISRESLQESITNVEFLKEEKECLMKVDHPCIVKLLCTYKDSQYLYLNMELIEGATLTQLLISNQQLKERFSGLILAQLIMIFEYIHNKNLIHRDIKSSNIIVNQLGQAKLIDLGESTQMKLIDGQIIKETIFCGTKHMMSPQFFNGDYQKGYGQEVDYYALGMLGYEMIVGESVFGYQGQNQNLEQDILNGVQQVHLEKINNHQLRDLLASLMKFNVQDRLKDIATLKAHPYFTNLVDWDDLYNFMHIPYASQYTPDQIDLIHFYSNNYAINFYQEDIELITHFTFDTSQLEKQQLSEQEQEMFQKFDNFNV